ncbi:hypothetical protein EG68_02702 [Paragonimus skrjabini miyazakii]|uniref:non-specific serine/threonine protein kinase n=1 Tax=Paragonimus skrjabini miyazakii TaxID=59628 RepID=A0A8S9YXK6_9TREM|nr:hypothetical protein EG68_02702 [Paragonimus skrjabini miyazakii]
MNLTNVVSRLVDGLKSRNEEDRLRTVQELYRIVDRELKEVSIQSYVFCLDLMCNQLLNMYAVGEIWEKKGAVIGMGCIAEMDFMSVHNYCQRFANLLQNRTASSDIQLIALEARLMGQFGLVFPYDFIDSQIKRACESLTSDCSDSQKNFSILLLREFVLNTPTSFYQHFGPFIGAILSAFRDKSTVTRELASLTLRSALGLAATREQRHRLGRPVVDRPSTGILSYNLSGSSTTTARHGTGQDAHAMSVDLEDMNGGLPSSVRWYRNCLVEVLRQFGETPTGGQSDSSLYSTVQLKKLNRDDWIHGSMLLLTELLASVLPKHEELCAELNEMAGLPLFDFLTVQQSDGTQAVRTVLASHWSFFNGSTTFITPGWMTPCPLADPRKCAQTFRFIQAGQNPDHWLGSTSSNAVSMLCHRVLLENIEEIWQIVLSWLKLRNQQLTILLFKLLPRLVALQPSYLNERELHISLMDWLFQYLSKDREKPMALICTALVGHHMRTEFCGHGWLTQMFNLIRSYLPNPRETSTKKRSAALETAAILSVGILAKSLGVTIMESLKQIMDSLVASGLNQPLISTFKVITEHVPQMRKEIQDQILNFISLALKHTSGASLSQVHASTLGSGAGVGSSTPIFPSPNVTGLLTSLIGQNPAGSSLGATGLGALSLPAPLSSSGSGLAPGSVSASGAGSNTPIACGTASGIANTSSVARMFFHATGKLHTPRMCTCGTSCTSAPFHDLGNVVFPGGLLVSGDSSPGIAVIALALKTLGSFTFKDRPLANFVRHISENFISVLTCDVKEIRLEAVKTCARLMLPWLKSVEPQHWCARPAVNTVADILGRLLTVGISDPDPDVRRCVFESIDPGFDPHLAQAEHLSSLFLALQDEVFDIRCLVMQRLGRLSDINPACVQPSLRRVLLHLLDDLANSGSTKNKEQSALLIACLISSATRFFTPYAEPVLQNLVPRIRQALPASLRAYLSALATSRLHTAPGISDTDRKDYLPLESATDLTGLHDSQLSTGAPPILCVSQFLSKGVMINPLELTAITNKLACLNVTPIGDGEPPGCPGGIPTLPAGLVGQTSISEGTQSAYGFGSAYSDISTQWTEPTAVVIALFTSLGRLSAVAPAAVRTYMDEFIPILCCMMQDPSCFPRRSIAVWTLSTLISNTGWVVLPYRRHPQLLPILLNLLKREESKEIRQEVLRALGVLGALDPFKFKLYTGQVDTFADTGIAVSLHEADERRDMDITQSELVVNLSWENRSVFFSVCALSALIHMLRDPALRSQYANIVRTIVYILDQLGPRSVYYLRQLMPDYFKCLQNARDVRLQELLIRQLGSIMSVVRLHTKEFASQVVDVLLSHWWVDPNVQNACIQLLSPMASVLGAEFRTHLTRLVPVILRTLHHESNEVNLMALLEILPQFGYTLEDHSYILVPAICNLLDVANETNLSVLLTSALDVPNKNATTGPSSSDVPGPTNVDDDDTASEVSLTLPQLDSLDDQQPQQSTMPASVSHGQAAVSGSGTSNVSFISSAVAGQGFVGSVQLRRAALECLARLTDLVDLDNLAGQIVHPICRLLLTLEACYQQFHHLTQHHYHLPSSSSTSSVKAAITQGIQSCNNAINLLHPAAMDVLTGLLLRTGQKFKLLLPLVQKMLNSLRIRPARFYTVLGRIEKGAYLPTAGDQVLSNLTSIATQAREQRATAKEPDPATMVKVFDTKGINLERAWRSTRLMNRDDWDQWLKTLTTTLLRESPNPAIRACSQLISVTPTIGRTLFNAAFVSCWPELTAPQQDALINKLEQVLLMSDQSPEVSQAILNLEEFMAHVDKYSSASTRVPLPLSLRLLADRAMKNRAFAKALYYKEQEFLVELEKNSSPSQETLSCLLTIYSKLQLEEAATGVLLFATRHSHDKLVNEEIWRERLQDWKCALNLYENKMKDERIKDKTPHMLGRMRCLRALGQWAPLNTMVNKCWDTVDDSVRMQMAPIACTAAWAVHEWTQVERYVSALPTNNSFDGAFYRAVLDIQRNHYDNAYQHILNARNVLDADLTAMTGESYDRAYADLVGTQLLSEAEEVIQYKQIPERRPILREAWQSRLRGCQSVVEDWSQIIQLRSLVFQPRDDLKTWLRFAGLCRRSGRFALARQLIQDLLGKDPAHCSLYEPIRDSDPATVFAYTKLLWATGAHEEAVTRLWVLVTQVLEPMLSKEPINVILPRPFASVLDANEILDSLDPRSAASQAALERQALRTLMAKCCLRLGLWYSDLYIRYPPNTGGADPTLTTPTFVGSSSGLQNSVATANRLSRLRGSEPWTTLNAEPTANHVSRANETRMPFDGESFRKATNGGSGNAYSNDTGSTLLNDGAGLNVPQAWDERQGFVIQCYDAATKHAPDNRFAWQAWAMTNYAVFKHLDALKEHIERAEKELNKANSHSPASAHSQSVSPSATSNGNLSPSAQTLANLWNAKTNLQWCMELHAVPSVLGFVNSISLSPSANLQDSLRLINLLFKFGHLAEIREVIREGLTKIRLSNWLLVIQQLLARIDTPREYVANIIVDLLISVGRSYPQSMVCPLVLAFKSGGSDRRRHNANRILYSMEEHSPRLVSEAFLLNEELIRLSITWVEMWSESLEDASRVYFGEKDIMKMFRILHPLHQMMDRGHETIHESTFLQDHGSELANCRICCETYERTSNNLVLQQAWEGYYTLYRRFTKQVNSMTTLELSVASPRLHEYRKDWELAVPGSYEPHRPLVRIAGIKNCLTLMTSKQHPRKLTVQGSDGHQYVFLLKGHEDTRQDERVMQFFGLVNTLLSNDPETLRRNLTIQRMSVIPLSTNTGLIGWVPSSDTLHSLIRDYREKTQTVLNKENREMILLAPDFDRLNVIQKTEIFEAGLRESSGRDLANILWLKSHSSEAWFERRTNFVRSMATMSMVGYILGLGDRHPSNIMLSRETGKVVHIDFGDCFEVAMLREKFPEKVPFRLTRMIIAAMEVTGIDGVYRHTCEMVMSLMRDNRESLLAVLEAFIHDPLLQWVLLENRKDFTNLDTKLEDGVMAGGQPAGNGLGAPVGNGAGPGLQATVQPTKTQLHRQAEFLQLRQNQMVGAQTTAARRPTDRTGGLAPNNTATHNPHDQHGHPPPTQYGPRRSETSPKRVFTNPNHPDSVSLRDPHKINPWRHHLCNGPWFGCYETAKRLRRQSETGHVVVERQGLQGFIFSAKPSSGDETLLEAESRPITLGNTRARAVMEKIHQKLTGTEREKAMDVSNQVNYLIREATSNQNLCQMYIGWCAFW